MDGPFRGLKPRGLSGGLISLGVAVALLYYGQLFLVTLSTAVIINFILEPFVGLLTRVRVPRALASFIVCSFAVCAVYFAGLGVYKQGSRLAEDVPKYAERIGDLSDGVLTKLESMEQAVSRNGGAETPKPALAQGASEKAEHARAGHAGGSRTWSSGGAHSA